MIVNVGVCVSIWGYVGVFGGMCGNLGVCVSMWRYVGVCVNFLFAGCKERIYKDRRKNFPSLLEIFHIQNCQRVHTYECP